MLGVRSPTTPARQASRIKGRWARSCSRRNILLVLAVVLILGLNFFWDLHQATSGALALDGSTIPAEELDGLPQLRGDDLTSRRGRGQTKAGRERRGNRRANRASAQDVDRAAASVDAAAGTSHAGTGAAAAGGGATFARTGLTAQQSNLQRVGQTDLSDTSTAAVPPAQCKIYVLDPSTELAPKLGIPSCNLSQAWPFDQPGKGVEGLDRTPHWAAQHASGHWVAQAILHSPHHTANLREADLVYINTHCYILWYSTLWRQSAAAGQSNPFNDAAFFLSRLFTDGVMAHKAFTATAGRRFIISRPKAGSPPGAMMDTCAKLKRTYMLASERAVFCDNDRDRAARGDSLILPYVVTMEGADVSAPTQGAPRPTLLYYHGACPTKRRGTAATPGGLLRDRMLEELGGVGGDVAVTCGCIECASAVKADAAAAAMRQAVFCPVLAAEGQGSRRLPAAALAGCLPVFFGPPFHALPLAGDIAYRDFAAFFNVTPSLHDQDVITEAADERMQPPPPGELEPNAFLDDEIMQVPDFRTALDMLRSMAPARVQAMQAALERDRLKFYYPPLPGGNTQGAGAVIVNRLCEYAARLNPVLAAARQEKLDKPSDMPKIPQGGFKRKRRRVNVGSQLQEEARLLPDER